MAVRDFECQIARGQIGRYVNAEGLSSETLRQLGAHVAECTDCKDFLDERRSALQGMLGLQVATADVPRATHAVVQTPKSASDTLIAKLREQAQVQPEAQPEVRTESTQGPKAKTLLGKPLMLSGGLAVVLIGMTWVTKNPTGILGPKASSAIAASSNPPIGKTGSDTKPTNQSAKPDAGKANAPKETPKPNDGAKPASDTAAQSVANKVTPVASNATSTTTPSKPSQAAANAPTKQAATIADPAKLVQTEPPAKKTSTPVKPTSKAAAKAKPAAKHHRAVRRHVRRRRYRRPGTGTIHVYTN